MITFDFGLTSPNRNELNFFIISTFIAAHIGSGQIMGWGEKAIEVRSVETGLLDGVFMHKRAQTFRFLCERNEKVKSLLNICVCGHVTRLRISFDDVLSC